MGKFNLTTLSNIKLQKEGVAVVGIFKDVHLDADAGLNASLESIAQSLPKGMNKLTQIAHTTLLDLFPTTRDHELQESHGVETDSITHSFNEGHIDSSFEQTSPWTKMSDRCRERWKDLKEEQDLRELNTITQPSTPLSSQTSVEEKKSNEHLESKTQQKAPGRASLDTRSNELGLMYLGYKHLKKQQRKAGEEQRKKEHNTGDKQVD